MYIGSASWFIEFACRLEGGRVFEVRSSGSKGPGNGSSIDATLQ